MYTADNFVINKDKGFIQANIKLLKEKATEVYLIKSDEEFRLDLISYRIYGSIDYKWVLMYINDIFNISQLKAKTEIYYCPFTEISSQLLKTLEKQ